MSVRLYGVYILRCADGTLYTGCTNNLQKRLKDHNLGRGSKYTRARLPVVIAYAEKVGVRSLALKREAEIKRLSRAGKLLLCSSYTGGRSPSRG